MAKAPTDTSTVCDRYQHSDIVFTGTAETAWLTMVDTRQSPIHKRSEKSKRVRFLVREWYKGERRTMVEVWMTPSDCEFQTEADQTYLIYAKIGKDKKGKERFESNGCMGSVPLSAAASDISFLTAAQLGPNYATRITGNAGAPNVTVTAKSGVNLRYATSDAKGTYTFDGLQAGDWQVSASGVTKPVHLEPNTCVTP
jgi:hypothetical protein